MTKQESIRITRASSALILLACLVAYNYPAVTGPSIAMSVLQTVFIIVNQLAYERFAP